MLYSIFPVKLKWNLKSSEYLMHLFLKCGAVGQNCSQCNEQNQEAADPGGDLQWGRRCEGF